MATDLTVSDVFRPDARWRAVAYDGLLIIFGSVLIGACAHIKFYLPFSLVPVTGQTFAVLMLGALLGPGRGVLCALAYLAEGAAGLPAFAGGVGPAALLGPTGGYLVGFVPAAALTGYLSGRGWDRSVVTTVLAMILGNLCIYACGLTWLGTLVGYDRAAAVGLYPFLIGDLFKIALAAVLLPGAWRLLRRADAGGRA